MVMFNVIFFLCLIYVPIIVLWSSFLKECFKLSKTLSICLSVIIVYLSIGFSDIAFAVARQKQGITKYAPVFGIIAYIAIPAVGLLITKFKKKK